MMLRAETHPPATCSVPVADGVTPRLISLGTVSAPPLTVMSAVPLVVAFLFLQKYIVESVAMSGIKQ